MLRSFGLPNRRVLEVKEHEEWNSHSDGGILCGRTYVGTALLSPASESKFSIGAVQLAS